MRFLEVPPGPTRTNAEWARLGYLQQQIASGLATKEEVQEYKDTDAAWNAKVEASTDAFYEEHGLTKPKRRVTRPYKRDSLEQHAKVLDSLDNLIAKLEGLLKKVEEQS